MGGDVEVYVVGAGVEAIVHDIEDDLFDDKVYPEGEVLRPVLLFTELLEGIDDAREFIPVVLHLEQEGVGQDGKSPLERVRQVISSDWGASATKVLTEWKTVSLA